MTELTGPIVFKDATKRIAYAAVLVPGEPDTDYPLGEKILTADEVERVAHEWLASYRNVDIQHTLNNVAVPVESYLLPMEMTVTAYNREMTLPKGTWILATKVLNDEVWEGIVTGKLTGYSVMGISRDELNRPDDPVPKSASLKRTLIRDLGEDWIAAFVSIVDEPAVPKAKFYALKAKDIPGQGVTEMEQNKIMDTLQSISKSLSELLTDKAKKEEEVTTPAPDQTAPAEKAETPAPAPVAPEQDATASIKDALKAELPAIIKPMVEKELSALGDEVKGLKETISALEAAQKQHGEEFSTFKTEINAFREDVVTRITKSIENIVGKKAAPKSLPGQDGVTVSEKSTFTETRDAYGRVRRNI